MEGTQSWYTHSMDCYQNNLSILKNSQAENYNNQQGTRNNYNNVLKQFNTKCVYEDKKRDTHYIACLLVGDPSKVLYKFPYYTPIAHTTMDNLGIESVELQDLKGHQAIEYEASENKKEVYWRVDYKDTKYLAAEGYSTEILVGDLFGRKEGILFGRREGIHNKMEHETLEDLDII